MTSIDIVDWGLWLLALYAAVGVCAAIVFVAFGVHRVDEQADGTGVGFRLLLLPGVALLWPLLLRKRTPRDDAPGGFGRLRRAHLCIWVALALLLPTLLAAALISRRSTTPRNPSLHWEAYR